MKKIIGKRFDEVFDLQMGKTPDRKNTLYFEGDNVWVSIRDMSNKDICESQEHISDDAIVNCAIKKVKAGTVIMSFKLTVGKCAIAAVDLYTNEAIMAFNLKDGYYIDSSFLYYYLQSYKWQGANKAVMGLTLNKATISKQIISIPPLPIQQKIVAELDKVCLIIEKKKQQLKELDNLAQAIFYDMFGDPVENEKGWEVKTMGEIGTLQRGSGLSKKDLVENGHPCILYGQIHTRFGAFTKTHIACIPDYLVNTAKIAHTGDLIMAITSEDVEGSCKSTAWLGNYDIAIGSDAAIFRHNQNGIYISYYTKTKAFYNEKAKFARGFKVTHISTKEIATIPIMIPPLSLQQSFAAKIEAIEKQKELISRSIKEAQTLFDERMDYWFD